MERTTRGQPWSPFRPPKGIVGKAMVGVRGSLVKARKRAV
jgi:hypothetical protein